MPSQSETRAKVGSYVESYNKKNELIVEIQFPQPREELDTQATRQFYQMLKAKLKNQSYAAKINHLIIGGGTYNPTEYLALFPNLPGLRCLEFSAAHLVAIPDAFLQKCRGITSLDISESNLMVPPNIEICPDLKEVHITSSDCHHLAPLSGLENLANLVVVTYGQRINLKGAKERLYSDIRLLINLHIALEVLRREAYLDETPHMRQFTPAEQGCITNENAYTPADIPVISRRIIQHLKNSGQLLQRLERDSTTVDLVQLAQEMLDPKDQAPDEVDRPLLIAHLPQDWRRSLNDALREKLEKVIHFCKQCLGDPKIQALIEKLKENSRLAKTDRHRNSTTATPCFFAPDSAAAPAQAGTASSQARTASSAGLTKGDDVNSRKRLK